MKGGEDGAMLALVGFDAATELLLLRESGPQADVRLVDSVETTRGLYLSSAYLQRDLNDLRRWDRALHRCTDHSMPRLPTKKLRKLMEMSWVRDEPAAGWRLELQKNVAVCEAWINAALASLPADERREFLDDELYAQAQERRSAERAAVQSAKDLQQYFTSQPLVEELVATVMARVGAEEGVALDDVVFLEPSFGDGRIIRTLVGAGARHVVGYEIDASLWRNSVTETEQLASMHLVAGDFLASKRTESSVSTRHRTVVAVGNPPFGDKTGDREQTEPPVADLVVRFMAHAAAEWRARLLVFIVPERCGKPAFVQSALQALAATSDGCQWLLESSTPLDGHTFELGAKRVKQPSVLQVFSRASQECSTSSGSPQK
jgi:predicted RNA methylase